MNVGQLQAAVDPKMEPRAVNLLLSSVLTIAVCYYSDLNADTHLTRNRAIAKALNLEGRTTSRQTF